MLEQKAYRSFDRPSEACESYGKFDLFSVVVLM
jgi:hypothetical protein